MLGKLISFPEAWPPASGGLTLCLRCSHFVCSSSYSFQSLWQSASLRPAPSCTGRGKGEERRNANNHRTMSLGCTSLLLIKVSPSRMTLSVEFENGSFADRPSCDCSYSGISTYP